LIKRVAAQGVGVIVISHNLDDVFAVAHRVVVLRLGRITLDASLCSTNREQIVAYMTGVSFGRTSWDGPSAS
jgi:D-xylose transport system ATP-binding protein